MKRALRPLLGLKQACFQGFRTVGPVERYALRCYGGRIVNESTEETQQWLN